MKHIFSERYKKETFLNILKGYDVFQIRIYTKRPCFVTLSCLFVLVPCVSFQNADVLIYSVSLCIIPFRIVSHIIKNASKHYTMMLFAFILIRFASGNKTFQILAFPFQSENIRNKTISEIP